MGPGRHSMWALRLPLGVCADLPAQHTSGHQGLSELDESLPSCVLAPGALGARRTCSVSLRGAQPCSLSSWPLPAAPPSPCHSALEVDVRPPSAGPSGQLGPLC